VPVGQALGQYYLRDELSSPRFRGEGDRPKGGGGAKASGDGSCIVVIATDAPLSDRNLERLAHRGLLGIARTGSPMTNGSGEYAVAFSTNLDVRRTPERRAKPSPIIDLPNDQMSPLFEAAVEAAEEAAINSLFAATPMDGNGNHVDALPVDKVVKLYRRTRR
jgi:D-aminopeptidase